MSLRFNSLQTGKHIQRGLGFILRSYWDGVSIPFKRESISKVKEKNTSRLAKKRFQFPSNGKAYPKQELRGNSRVPPQKVSIPFKRESISKGIAAAHNVKKEPSFNSLQTGKHIQSLQIWERWPCSVGEFQFPSNGKAYPKKGGVPPQAFIDILRAFQFPSNGKAYPKPSYRAVSNKMNGVSIPFKRESISKAMFRQPRRCGEKSFNSLQTGKHIQRNPQWAYDLYVEFQFPSNGKAYPKD